MTEPLWPILVVAGATGTGKTSVAIELARHFGGELVGADSVQVYRGFDIGAAKPTASELGDVRHHLIDVFDPDQDVDAMTFAKLADTAIGEIRGRGHLPIIVGGTGLWIRALVRGLVAVPPVDPALRSRLEAAARNEGAAALHAKLTEVDPLAAELIHPNDALRIVRALEVSRADRHSPRSSSCSARARCSALPGDVRSSGNGPEPTRGAHRKAGGADAGSRMGRRGACASRALGRPGPSSWKCRISRCSGPSA